DEMAPSSQTTQPLLEAQQKWLKQPLRNTLVLGDRDRPASTLRLPQSVLTKANGDPKVLQRQFPLFLEATEAFKLFDRIWHLEEPSAGQQIHQVTRNPTDSLQQIFRDAVGSLARIDSEVHQEAVEYAERDETNTIVSQSRTFFKFLYTYYYKYFRAELPKPERTDEAAKWLDYVRRSTFRGTEDNFMLAEFLDTVICHGDKLWNHFDSCRNHLLGRFSPLQRTGRGSVKVLKEFR
ncbi:hypothetical protein JCM11641_002104, partial [Rhodosporidiobolus odoratus]